MSEVAQFPTVEERLSFTSGGSFILDNAADPEPLWGEGDRVLLAEGEALVIVGGQGAGKTTLAQQLALGRCGFAEYSELLGMPITPNQWGTTLYLAMDRPRQAARSFRRMVGESWRGQLDAELLVWEGPPLADIARFPRVLRNMCEEASAETVVIDSLKDAAIGLSEDEVGAGYNRARQMALAAGVQVIEVHHNRKAGGGMKSAGPSIDDVYGSTWLTSGAGSVVLLAGAPGDPVVSMHHLKQPASEVGPMKIVHDHERGRSTVWESVDLVALLSMRPEGLTAIEAARVMFDDDKPNAALQEKARRRLQGLTKQGLIACVDEGDRGSKRSSRWGSLVTQLDITRTSREVLEPELHTLITDTTDGA